MRLEGLHVPARKRHTEETGRSDEPGPPGALLTAPWSTGTGNIRLSIPQASSVISLERSGPGSDGGGRTDGRGSSATKLSHAFLPCVPWKAWSACLSDGTGAVLSQASPRPEAG